MAESEGMAIIPWTSLGGGQLMSRAQREEAEKNPNRPAAYTQSEDDVKACDAIESIATKKACSFQAVALAYLFAQSTYVSPILGTQTVGQVEAMDNHLKIELTPQEVEELQTAKDLKPQFPTDFLYSYSG